MSENEEYTEYERYAPEGSYDQGLQPGQSNLLILDHYPNEARVARAPEMGGMHGNLACHIARQSAENVSKKLGSDTRPTIEASETRITASLDAEDYANIPTELTTKLPEEFYRADVINFSNESDGGGLDGVNPFDMEAADLPILVQGAGNEGDDNDAAINRDGFDIEASQDYQYLFPHSISVGEVTRDDSGALSLDEHSSRHGVTLVAENGSETGNGYKYYGDVDASKQERLGIDQDGFLHGEEGTSFSTPVVSGALAAAMEKYPNLTNDEVLAALYTSCDDIDLKGDVELENAAGLEYSQYSTGFGVYNSDRFAEHVEKMNEISMSRDPQQSVSTHVRDFSKLEAESGNRYAFEVTEDMSVSKVVFRGAVDPDSKVPDTATLISPDGTTIEVPKIYYDEDNQLRFVTEGVFAEDAKGTWILDTGDATLVSENDVVGETVLTVHGQEKGPDGRSNVQELVEETRAGPPQPDLQNGIDLQSAPIPTDENPKINAVTSGFVAGETPTEGFMQDRINTQVNELIDQVGGMADRVSEISEETGVSNIPFLNQASGVLEQGFNVLESGGRVAGDKMGMQTYDEGFMGGLEKVGDYAVLAQAATQLQDVASNLPELTEQIPYLGDAIDSLSSTIEDATGVDIRAYGQNTDFVPGAAEPQNAAPQTAPDASDASFPKLQMPGLDGWG